MNAVSIISVILSVVAIVVTIILSRRQMKRNTVIHFRIDEYDIGKGLSDEFPDFKLTYSGNKLTTNVKAIKGGLMNKGKNDIDTNSIFELIFPDDCTVRDFNLKLSNDNIKVIKEICEEKPNIVKLTIQEGIFRTDTYFEYTAIVETPRQEKLGNKIKFENNVLNTDIKNIFVGSVLDYKDTELFSIRFVNITLVITSLICSWLFLNQPVQVEVLNKSTNETVKIVEAPNNQLYEGTILSGKKISNEDLSINYHFVPKVINRTYKFWIVLIVLIAGFIIINFIDFSGGKRYVIKVLEAAEKAKKSDEGQEKSNFLSGLFG